MPQAESHLELSIALGEASFHASGPAELVMQALREFKALSAEPARPKSGGPTKKATADAPPREDNATPPQDSAASKVPLPQFLQEEGIKQNSHIATGIVAWAADHDGKAHLTVPEIKALWKRTTVKVPGNLNRDVERAAKNGWLTKETAGYAVTGFGRSTLGLK